MAKRHFKVVQTVERRGAPSFDMRVGTAVEHEDGTIRVYLDAIIGVSSYKLVPLVEEDVLRGVTVKLGGES
jgi:hypothetical protein